MLGQTYERNGARLTRYADMRINREILRTKIMPEYTIPTRLPGIIDVTEIPTANGQVITVTTDENGDVVAAEKKPNLLPLALAAGAAYLFLM